MDFSALGKIGANSRWDHVYEATEKHILKNHHKFKLEKARLIGYLMGDGSLTSKKYKEKAVRNNISFYPDDFKIAKIFIRDFQKLYLKKPSLRSLHNYYKVSAESRPAWDDLSQIGMFDSLNWEFPSTLISKEEKIEWLKALFDCEAYVDIKKKRIVLQSVSINGINSIKLLLENFKIISKIYIYKRKNIKWNVNHLLFISRKENVNKYAKLINFNHSYKKEKLRKIADVPER